nr:GMC oxidoreductase [Streptomyces roseifaciens]
MDLPPGTETPSAWAHTHGAAASGRTEYPAIVIGSGFGGAVCALRLGQAGVDTLVLERGREWTTDPHRAVFGSQLDYSRKMFWFRPIAHWPLVLPFPMGPYAGMIEVSNERGIDIACAAGLGGGSLVYTCATVAPPRKHFERIFPDGITYREMDSVWYPKAAAMLRPSVMPNDIYASAPFTHSRVWDKHVGRAGYEPVKMPSTFNWEVIRQELLGTARASAIAGESDFGCSNGAKNSLTVNYLPAARATGHVTVQTLCEVESIGLGRPGTYTVTVRHIDTNGSLLEKIQYSCKWLFVCAGTLNTNRLLVAARDTGELPALDDSVGVGFGDNGDQFIGYGYIGEGGPSQGAPSASTIFTEEFVLPIRAENWHLMQLGQLPGIMTLTMTADPDPANRGRFSYDSSTGKVTLSDWSGKSDAAAQAASGFIDKVMNANSNTIPAAIRWPCTFTPHPLGGCVLGKATDLYGRLRGYRGLYAVDGSLIPGNVGGANPSFTITALAERCIADIIARKG